MEKNYRIIFDDVILGQLKKLGKNESVRVILSKMFDKIEEKGNKAGKLIDSKLFIYEMKNKKPPIRLYFKPVIGSKDIYLFQYEIKTSKKKQKFTIDKLKFKVRGILDKLKF